MTATKGACPAESKRTELGAEGKEGTAGKPGVLGKRRQRPREGSFFGPYGAETKTLEEVLGG